MSTGRRLVVAATWTLAACGGASPQPGPDLGASEPARASSSEPRTPSDREGTVSEPGEPTDRESAASEPRTPSDAESAPSDAPSDAPSEPRAPSDREATLEQMDPVEELAALGANLVEQDPEGGGSIRAKRDPPQPEAAPEDTVEAKVVGVAQGSFPLAALKVQVLSAPRQGPAKDLARNQIIVVLPTYAVREGAIDLRAPMTVRNAMAFYLVHGDRVTLQLAPREGKAWRALSIVRE